MGSPIAYESRRKELEHLWAENFPDILPSITNYDVTQSFIDLIESKNQINNKYNNIEFSEQARLLEEDTTQIRTKGSARSSDFRSNSNLLNEELTVSSKKLSIIENNHNVHNYLLQYLKCCSIGVILGDVLFIHGGLHSYNIGLVLFTFNLLFY